MIYKFAPSFFPASMSDKGIYRQPFRTSSDHRKVQNHRLLTVVGMDSQQQAETFRPEAGASILLSHRLSHGTQISCTAQSVNRI